MRIRSLVLATIGAAGLAAPIVLSSSVFAQSPNGEALFRTNCAACHGQNGEGGFGPTLAGNTFVSSVSSLVNQIFFGNAERGMPGFTQLDNATIAAISTHVRNSWGNAFGPVTPEEVAGFRPPPG
jgi:mono/diheme cytochrome c family protein